MGIWLQSDARGIAEPAVAKRLSLALLGHRHTGDLKPLLYPPIPAVDGVIVSNDCDVRGLTLPLQIMRQEPLASELATGSSRSMPAIYDHLIWLRAGESLLLGDDVGVLRHTAQAVSVTSLLPVHYPLPGSELPITLLSLEPRWIARTGESTSNPGFLGLPIESDLPPVAPSKTQRADLAWVLLYRANHAIATGESERGQALLDQLYTHAEASTPAMAGVVVRNGIAGALASRSDPWLDRWLARGSRLGGSPDVQLLGALVPYFQGDPAGTVDRLTGILERSLSTSPERWISGGGESSYRLLTYRGMAYARLGAMDKAVSDWGGALRLNPNFLLPLRLLAEHRLHVEVLDRIGLWEYRFGRGQSAALLAAKAYAQSSDPNAANAVVAELKPSVIPKELRQLLQRRRPGTVDRERSTLGSVRWEGPFFNHSSLARVNRAIGARLIDRQWLLGAVPTEPQSYTPGEVDAERLLADQLWRHLDADVTVRHCWPPDWRPVDSGKLVLYLPWEFGAIAREWVEQIRQVDQVWVYAESVRQGLIASGVDPNRVVVVPCGIDPELYHPGVEAKSTAGPFRFLYVGGTIERKGYDLALGAFLAEFAADERVTLIVKDFGSDTFYQGMNGSAAVREAAEATAGLNRQVLLIDDLLSDHALAELYRSADCLVAPYRAEGFCLPALEAMACGTPAILPQFGPALDYALPETALMLPVTEFSLGDRIDGMSLAGEGVVCQVSMGDLRRTMRWAAQNRQELHAMGQRAATSVAAQFTWEHAARRAEAQLRQIRGL